MEVMTLHKWLDTDVERVVMTGRDDVREIDIRDGTGALLISKEDAIALAKEFNLVVYEKDAAL